MKRPTIKHPRDGKRDAGTVARPMVMVRKKAPLLKKEPPIIDWSLIGFMITLEATYKIKKAIRKEQNKKFSRHHFWWIGELMRVRMWNQCKWETARDIHHELLKQNRVDSRVAI